MRLLIALLFLLCVNAQASSTTIKQMDTLKNSTGGNALSVPAGGVSDSLATLTGTQTFGAGSTWNGVAIGTAYGGVGTWQQDIFTGCNGSTTAFTLSYAPTATAVVRARIDGLEQTYGGGYDFTVSSTTLTLVSACASGQTLVVSYTH